MKKPLVQITKNNMYINDDIIGEIQKAYQQASRRLFLLDYDGTLVPFKKKPEGRFSNGLIKAKLEKITQSLNLYNIIRERLLEKQLNTILRTLCTDYKNKLVIISGRNKDFLEKKFQALPLFLVAEHGAWLKEPGLTWIKKNNCKPKWKKLVEPLFKLYQLKCPGAIIEEKDFSLAWHYRMVKESTANNHVCELKKMILNAIADSNLIMLEGNKVLEVKYAEINKGKITKQFLAQNQFDFILGIGDDQTDEDIFNALPPNSFSIKVGSLPTAARYRITGYNQVRQVLTFISGHFL